MPPGSSVCHQSLLSWPHRLPPDRTLSHLANVIFCLVVSSMVIPCKGPGDQPPSPFQLASMFPTQEGWDFSKGTTSSIVDSNESLVKSLRTINRQLGHAMARVSFVSLQIPTEKGVHRVEQKYRSWRITGTPRGIPMFSGTTMVSLRNQANPTYPWSQRPHQPRPPTCPQREKD